MNLKRVVKILTCTEKLEYIGSVRMFEHKTSNGIDLSPEEKPIEAEILFIIKSFFFIYLLLLYSNASPHLQLQFFREVSKFDSSKQLNFRIIRQIERWKHDNLH